MKYSKTLLALAVGLLLACNAVAGTQETSFRMRGIGEELQWIVPDAYSDLQINPLSMNELDRSLVLTNLSNLNGIDHRFFDYGYNQYENEAGSFLAGGFTRTGGWSVGAVGNFWRARNWETAARKMNTDFSDSYSFNWYGNYGSYNTLSTGTTITDFDNGTATTTDDYRVVETTSGIFSDSESSGLDLKVFAGNDDLGLSYRYERTVNLYNDPYSDLTNATHTYDLLEVGSSSAQEAVAAVQSETFEIDNRTHNHTLSLGTRKELSGVSSLDIVGRLIYRKEYSSLDDRRSKTIDFDPDNDNQPFESAYSPRYYNQYKYQGLQQENADRDGWGYRLDARYSREMSPTVDFKVVGRLDYLPLDADDYSRADVSLENMTVFDGGTPFSNSSEFRASGTQEVNTLNSLVGCGAVFRPADNLLIGFGVKWYRTYREEFSNMSSVEDGTTYPSKTEDKWTANRCAIPVGFEYVAHERYAFRLGALTNFLSRMYESAVTGVMDEQSLNQTVDLRSKSYEYWTTTEYSYGFGFRANENLRFDLTGITDLLRINNLLVSCQLEF